MSAAPVAAATPRGDVAREEVQLGRRIRMPRLPKRAFGMWEKCKTPGWLKPLKGVSEFANATHLRVDMAPTIFVPPSSFKGGKGKHVPFSPHHWAEARVSMIWGLNHSHGEMELLFFKHDVLWSDDHGQKFLKVPTFAQYAVGDTLMVTGFTLRSHEPESDEESPGRDGGSRADDSQTAATAGGRGGSTGGSETASEADGRHLYRLDDLFSEDDTDTEEAAAGDFGSVAEAFAAILPAGDPEAFQSWHTGLSMAADILMKAETRKVCPFCATHDIGEDVEDLDGQSLQSHGNLQVPGISDGAPLISKSDVEDDDIIIGKEAACETVLAAFSAYSNASGTNANSAPLCLFGSEHGQDCPCSSDHSAASDYAFLAQHLREQQLKAGSRVSTRSTRRVAASATNQSKSRPPVKAGVTAAAQQPDVVVEGQQGDAPADVQGDGQAEPDGDEDPESKTKQPPCRILPPVETTIRHEDHAPLSNPRCCDCQIPGMRDRRHDRFCGSCVELGGFAIDLVERKTQSNRVEFSLVGVSLRPPTKPKKVRKIYISVPLTKKSKAELLRGLMSLLLRAEHVYGAAPISRVHGDRESALLSLDSELHKLAIVLTTTAGQDAKGNGAAESAISSLVRVARSSLYRALRGLPAHLRHQYADLLWGHAMSHAADMLSCEEYKKYGENDDPLMRTPRLTTKDILPFLAEVIYRVGGKRKASRTNPVAITAYNLGGHHFVPMGTKVLTCGEDYMVETRSTTLRAITTNDNYRYPTSLPLKEYPRPKLGEDNEYYCWLPCSKCNKFRCVPSTLPECLEDWGTTFYCNLSMDAEGVFLTCQSPVEVIMDRPGVIDGDDVKKKPLTGPKHAGQAPRKGGRRKGQTDTKPRKQYNDGKPRKSRAPAEASQGLVSPHGQQPGRAAHCLASLGMLSRSIIWGDAALGFAGNRKQRRERERNYFAEFEKLKSPPPHGEAASSFSAVNVEAGEGRQKPFEVRGIHHVPRTPAQKGEEDDSYPTIPKGEKYDPVALMAEWDALHEHEKREANLRAAAGYARMLRFTGMEEENVHISDPEEFHAMLDWFSSEEAIRQEQDAEQNDDAREPVDLGHVEWEVYSAKYAKDGKPTVSSSVYDVRNLLKRAADQASEGELGKLPSPEAFVYQALKIKDARDRSAYVETVAKEVGRMLEFQCWGKPVARSSISEAAWVYRVNLLYGIKNAEVPEKAKDKARLVLMGNLRFTKSGKLLLDRWFRTPGEFWAPASSMAGMRFVAALAVLMGLPVETIDLDSAYLQTSVKATGDYLELSKEVIEGLTDDWQAAIKEAEKEDRRLGGNGDVVFPLYKNLYGKAPSGTNFITDLQTSLIQLDWVRLPHCPGTFMKRCPSSGRPMVIANYVDDFAAVLTKESGPAEWEKLKKFWKFDPPRVIDRFLGVETFYPEGFEKNPRHLVLHQSGYLLMVVERYEEHCRKNGLPSLKSYVSLPTSEPTWPEEDYRKEAGTPVRSVVGGIAYAARGTRPDLMKAFHVLSRRVTKWTDGAEDFMRRVLGYIKSTLNVGLVMNATGASDDVADWRIDCSVDASLDLPWSQSGFMITLTPKSSDKEDVRPPFLPVDWSSSGQAYVKLSPGESETVACVQAARGGLRYKYSWDDVCAAEAPHPMLIREDNSQAEAFVERGWSPTMMHLPRVYAINILWVTERLREGIFEIMHEKTSFQLADPLTKVIDPKVYYERGILSRFAWQPPEATMALIRIAARDKFERTVDALLRAVQSYGA